MTGEEIDVAKSALNDIENLIRTANLAAEPARALLQSGLFIAKQKLEWLLGARE